jgi:hypothetical protein
MSDYRDALRAELEAVEQQLEAQIMRRADSVSRCGYDHPLTKLEVEYEHALEKQASGARYAIQCFDEGAKSVAVAGSDPELLASLEQQAREVRNQVREVQRLIAEARNEIERVDFSDVQSGIDYADSQAEDAITSVDELIESISLEG